MKGFVPKGARHRATTAIFSAWTQEQAARPQGLGVPATRYNTNRR
jgi:hypothetical protein